MNRAEIKEKLSERLNNGLLRYSSDNINAIKDACSKSAYEFGNLVYGKNHRHLYEMLDGNPPRLYNLKKISDLIGIDFYVGSSGPEYVLGKTNMKGVISNVAALGKSSGLTRATIYRVFKEPYNVSLITYEKIADALNCRIRMGFVEDGQE